MKDLTPGAPERPDTNDPLKSERIGGRLTAAEIASRRADLPGWELVDGETALRRTYEFAGFRAALAALAFATYVVELAEAMDHRPGIKLRDTTVILTLTTRAAGGFTDKDLALATAIQF